MSIARAGNEKKNFDARPLQTLSLHLFHLSLRHCPHNSPAATSPPPSPQIPPPSTVCANPAATLTRPAQRTARHRPNPRPPTQIPRRPSTCSQPFIFLQMELDSVRAQSSSPRRRRKEQCSRREARHRCFVRDGNESQGVVLPHLPAHPILRHQVTDRLPHLIALCLSSFYAGPLGPDLIRCRRGWDFPLLLLLIWG